MSAENYNWPRFYKVLGEKGPDLLIGVDKKVIDCFIRGQEKKEGIEAGGIEAVVRNRDLKFFIILVIL